MNKSRKHNFFFFLLAWVSAIALILAALNHFAPQTRKEPVYRGKSLTQWLMRLDDGQAIGISSSALPSPTPSQTQAAEAIRVMGPAALPLLMEDIHARPVPDSPRMKARERLNSLTWPVFGRPLFGNPLTKEDRIRWRAAQGLAALGPIAKPALPELERLLLTNFWHSSIKEAAYALATIGPEGIHALTNAVHRETEWSGMCAIWALGQHPSAGTNLIPFFIGATSSTSEGTACGAIDVLGLFHMDAEHVVPALTNSLGSANSSIRDAAFWSLEQFGPQAASALPLLRSLTNSPRADPRVIEALRKIEARLKARTAEPP